MVKQLLIGGAVVVGAVIAWRIYANVTAVKTVSTLTSNQLATATNPAAPAAAAAAGSSSPAGGYFTSGVPVATPTIPLTNPLIPVQLAPLSMIESPGATTAMAGMV